MCNVLLEEIPKWKVDCIYIALFYITTKQGTFLPIESNLGFSVFQGYFDMWTRWAADQTANLVINEWAALPPETQPPQN